MINIAGTELKVLYSIVLKRQTLQYEGEAYQICFFFRRGSFLWSFSVLVQDTSGVLTHLRWFNIAP